MSHSKFAKQDISPASRSICQQYSQGPVYGNIAELLTPIYDVNRSDSWSYSMKQAFFETTNLQPAWDYRSESMVPLPQADLDMTGTPCQDWSPAFLDRPGIEGASSVCLQAATVFDFF